MGSEVVKPIEAESRMVVASGWGWGGGGGVVAGGWEEKKRERETQNLKQAPDSEMSAQSPKQGSNPQTMRS